MNTKSTPYRAYLLAIAVVPMSGLFLFDFRSAVKIYAVVGAFFIPMLAAVLLYLNGSSRLVGQANRNSPMTTAVLGLALAVFLIAVGFEITRVLR